MRATQFQSFLIKLSILYSFFKICFLVDMRYFFNKLTRASVDQINRNWAIELLNAVKATYKINDPQHTEFKTDRCYIIMSNHCSHLDIPVISLVFPKISLRMIAKKELFDLPFFGKSMHRSGYICIDRDNKKQAIKDLRIAEEKMRSGIVVWIAPEGTRSRSGKLQELKKGGFQLALHTNSIIIPVGIQGTAKILPPDTLDFSVNEHIEVNVGKAIDTLDYSKDQKDQLIQDVEKSIRKAAGQGEDSTC